MIKKIVLVIVCVALAAALLAGCNESYKTKPVATEASDAVVSNGGLAVRYGKYLYYINGYAGNEAANNFGEVQKGAVARVELDANGDPIKTTNIIIVPKNVYNTAATSGLYIVDGYVYYSTTSVDKNSKGEPKISEMWLMRTKTDGTGTQVVKKFENFNAVYKVTAGCVLYVLDNELHAIDTSSKKFEDTKIDEKVNSYVFTKYDEKQNSFIDSVFYLKASDDANSYHNVLWLYRAGGTAKKVFEANAATYGVADVYPSGFQLSLVEAVYAGDNIRLIYDKTDEGTNKTSAGTYSYDFDGTATFNAAGEVRYSKKTTYKDFYFLNATTAIIKNGTNVELLYKNSEEWTRQSLIPNSTDVSVFRIVESESEVEVYYLLSNIVYRIPVLDKTVVNGTAVYSANIKSSSIVFDASFSSTWLSLDLVGDTVYFFNSKVLDNTYFLNISTVIDRNADSRISKLLGLVTAEDEVAMLATSSQS